MGLKLITFDATNTLLRFKVPPWQYYATIAGNYGFKGTEDIVKSQFQEGIKVMWNQYPNFGKSSMSWEDWWRKVVKLTFKGQLPATTNIDAIANKLIDEYRTANCWYAAIGGEELLQSLRKRRIPLGVISNFDPRLKDILHNVNLLKYFDFVITSYDVGFSKPDVRIFKTALSLCKEALISSDALHIGDDVKKDYEGARAAGWNAILINANINNETPPAENHVFTDLEQLRFAMDHGSLRL